MTYRGLKGPSASALLPNQIDWARSRRGPLATSRPLLLGIEGIGDFVQYPHRRNLAPGWPARAKGLGLSFERGQEPPCQSLTGGRELNHRHPAVLVFASPADVPLSRGAVGEPGHVRAIAAQDISQVFDGGRVHGGAQELRLLRCQPHGSTCPGEGIVQRHAEPAKSLGESLGLPSWRG